MSDQKSGMGSAELEAAIMDRWDAGMSQQAIAADLGLAEARVRFVLSYMRETATDRALSPKVLSCSSKALVAAIRRHHPRQCRA